MNRNLYVVDGNDHSTMIRTICPFCGRIYTFVVSMNKDEFKMRLGDYFKGSLIQNCFPEIDADTREFIKTGICIDCFPNNDEE